MLTSRPFARATLAFSLAVLALVPAVGNAATGTLRATQQLPNQTVAFVRVENTADLVQRLKQTAIGQALQDPQLSPLVKHLWSSVLVSLEKFEQQAGMGLDELLLAAPGELVVAVLALPEGPPVPVLMFQADAKDATWELLRRGEGKLVENGFQQATETIEGLDVQILTTDAGPVEEIVQLQLGDWRAITTDRRAAVLLVGAYRGAEIANLADHPPFRAIMTRCSESSDEAQVEWFVDPLNLVKTSFRGNFAASAGLALLPAIGADGLLGVGGRVSLATDEFDILARTHVLIEPPRDGVLEVIGLGQGSTEPEPWVPADVASYISWHLEVDQSYRALKSLVDSFRGDGTVERFVNSRFSEQLGVDFEKEIVAALAGRVTQCVKFPTGASLSDSQNVFAFELNDADAFAATMTKIVTKWTERIERHSFGGIELYQLKTPAGEEQRDEVDGDESQERRRRNGPPQWTQTPPVAAILGSHLIVTNQRAMMEQCILTYNDSQPRLMDELDYKLVISKLRRQSGTPPAMIRFERPEQGMRVMYEMLQTEEMRTRIHEQRESNPFFAALDDAIKENRFPAFAVIAQYLAPSGSALFNEESGFHHVSFGLRRNIQAPLRSAN